LLNTEYAPIRPGRTGLVLMLVMALATTKCLESTPLDYP
jgi:hypothetical protein